MNIQSLRCDGLHERGSRGFLVSRSAGHRAQADISRAPRLTRVQATDVAVGSETDPRTARILASKFGVVKIVEGAKPLADYMALPASQYSVLDGRRVERIDDESFRCYVGKLQFASLEVEPVLTVSVVVEDKGCTIKLLSCQLQGSRFVEDINNKFQARMTNVVRWRASEDAEQSKEISSKTEIEVVLAVPGWCSFVPNESIQGVGSSVLQGVLNAMVPRFLAQLQKDYLLWASGDESRRPVGEL